MQTLILESGLYFDPPPGSFRFEDSAYFRDQLKRYGLCEMDFGWWAAVAAHRQSLCTEATA